MLSRGQALTLKLNEPRASLLLKWFKMAFYQLRGCEVTLGSGNFTKQRHSIWSGQPCPRGQRNEIMGDVYSYSLDPPNWKRTRLSPLSNG